MSTGVLFIGHGTRLPEGIAQCHAFTRAVRHQLRDDDLVCEDAFLELQSPDIPAAIRRLVEQGALDIVAVPIFLFEAGHLRVDIPACLANSEIRVPHAVRLLPALGADAGVLPVVRANLDIVGWTGGPQQAIAWIGRGNRDEAAQRTFDSLVGSYCTAHPNALVTTGYLAGTGRTLENALDDAVRAGACIIHVLPYLLFDGWLTTTQLPGRICAWQRTHPRVDVRVAPHLGWHPALVQLFARRVQEALDAGLDPMKDAVWSGIDGEPSHHLQRDGAVPYQTG